MVGSIRWNVIIALVGFVLTLLNSYANNIWFTTLTRSAMSAVICFFVVFIFRWMLGTLAGLSGQSASISHAKSLAPSGAMGEDERDKGQTLDLSTPDEQDELQDLLKPPSPVAAPEGDFAPLQPPKLAVKRNEATNIEKQTEALRQLIED